MVIRFEKNLVKKMKEEEIVFELNILLRKD